LRPTLCPAEKYGPKRRRKKIMGGKKELHGKRGESRKEKAWKTVCMC
jgi:hypothetical protein